MLKMLTLMTLHFPPQMTKAGNPHSQTALNIKWPNNWQLPLVVTSNLISVALTEGLLNP